ncbi:MAG: tyrosine-type recombinase/integrase [Bacilli bacterium]
MEVLRAISPELLEAPNQAWQVQTKSALKVMEGRQSHRELDLEQACALYLKSLYRRGQSDSTIRRTYYYLKMFTVWCKSSKIHDLELDKTTVRAFLSHCKRERKVGSVSLRMYYYKVKGLFSFLVEQGIMEEHPMEFLALPTLGTPRLKQVLSIEESSQLLQCVITEYQSLPKHHHGLRFMVLRDLIIIELMLATGLRVSEVAALTVQDVDLKNGLLRVQGKGSDLYVKRSRIAFIHHPQFMEDFGLYLTMHHGSGTDPLFPSNQNRSMTPSTFDLMVKKWGQRAGFTRKLHCHLFRHTFCTQLVLNGADMYSVQKLMGHHDVETTLRFYLHLTAQETKQDWKLHNPLSGR